MTAQPQTTRSEVLELLARSPTFGALGPDRLARLVGQSAVESFPAGATLFRQGDTGTHAYLVLNGETVVNVATEHGEVTVAALGRGDLVGEIAAFAATPRTASVVARTDCQLLRIEQVTIRAMIADSPDAALSVIAELGTRFQRLNGSLATLTNAATALARGDFEPDMLETLRRQADRFAHFADVFEAMARQIHEKRLFQQEMATAAEIQKSYLPAGLDAGAFANRFEIGATMRPAREVGGDFYDYFMVDERRLAVAVGDVSGKGIPAAMFMGVSRTVLRAIARQGGAPGEVLTEVNRILAEDNAEGMFVTLAYGLLDLPTGELQISSGAHEEVFLLTAAGTEQLGRNGPALGLFEGPVFGTETRRLAPGDRLFIATDGVTEAFDAQRQVFGLDRLLPLLDRGLSAEALVAAVDGTVVAHEGEAPQSDDCTCLALAYSGG